MKPCEERIVLSIVTKEEELLLSIFIQDEENKYIIVKNCEKIPELLSELYSTSTSEESRQYILDSLCESFSNAECNMEIFSHYTSLNEHLTLFEILVSLYLNDDTEEKLKQSSFLVLKLLAKCLTCTRREFSFLNGEIRKFIPNYTNNTSMNKLTKKKFKNYLNILKLYYAIDEEKGKDIFNAQVDNYFYFTGESALELKVIKEKKTLPPILKLEVGISICFWFKSYSHNKQYSLLSIKFAGEESNAFSFDVDKDNNLKSTIDNKPITNFALNRIYNVIFSLQSPAIGRSEIEVYINGYKEDFTFDHVFKKKKDIEIITLFNSFRGVCTSILIFKGNIKNVVDYFFDNKDKKFTKGVFNEELLISLIESNESISNKEKKTQKASKDILAIYIPTRVEYNPSNSRELILKETKNDLDGILRTPLPYLNGVHIYDTIINRIAQFGGISNVLPLLEIILKNEEYSSKIEVINDIESINDIFRIINTLLSSKNPKPLKDTEESKFFLSLSLFLENLPIEVFQDSTFSDYFISFSSFIHEGLNDSFLLQYYLYIFLNEKILLKFPLKIQSSIFNQIIDSTKDENKNKFLSFLFKKIELAKIIKIILHYDREKFHKFCCKAHSELFNEGNEEIMEPEMKKRLEPFQPLVLKILITKPFIEITSFFHMLTLELSPCLQLFVINSFVKTVNALNPIKENESISQNIIETILFALSVSHLGVRGELLKVFFNFIKKPFMSLKQNKKASYGKLLELYFFPKLFFIGSKEDNEEESENESEIISEIERENEDKLNNILIDGDLYIKAKKEKGKRLLVNLYKPEKFNVECSNIQLQILEQLNNDLLKTNIINCLITLSTNSEVSIASGILNTIKKIHIFETGGNEVKSNIKGNMQKLIDSKTAFASNRKFVQFIIDIAFHAFLIIKMPEYKSQFIIHSNDFKGHSAMNIYTSSMEIMKIIFHENVFLLDNVLNWGTYYKKLFNKNREFYLLLMEFIRTILKEVKEMFLLNIEKRTDNRIRNEKLFLLTILFEFVTFYKNDDKIRSDEDINNIKEKEKDKGKVKENDKKIEKGIEKDIEKNKDIEKDIGKDKDMEKDIEKDMEKDIEKDKDKEKDIEKDIEKEKDLENNRDKAKDKDIEKDLEKEKGLEKNKEIEINKDIEKNKTKIKHNVKEKGQVKLNIINRLMLLLDPCTSSDKSALNDLDLIEDIINQYIPDFNQKIDSTQKELFDFHFNKYQKEKLIFDYNIFIFPLTEKNISQDHTLFTPLIPIFGIFALQITESESEKLKKILEKFERTLKIFIISSTFLKYDEKMKEQYMLYQMTLKIIIYFSFRLLLNEISKRKKYPFLKNTLSNISKICLDFVNKSHSKIKGQKRENELKIFNFLKKTDYFYLENTSIYKLVFDLYSNKKSFESIEKELEKLRDYNEIEIKKMINEDQNFKNSFYKPSLIKDLEKLFFVFKDVYYKRQKNLKHIIPFYDIDQIIIDNNIHYDYNVNNLITSCKYLREDYRMNTLHIAQTRKQISDLLEEYKIKQKFENFLKVKTFHKIKKRLFSFTGVWSDKSIFYPNKLKLKIINHFTRDLTKILMTPIINITTYLPSFKYFNISAFFNSDDNDSNKSNDLIDLKPPKADHIEIISDIERNPYNDNENCNILYYIYKEKFSPLYYLKKSKNDPHRQFMPVSNNENNFLSKCCLITKDAHLKGYYSHNDKYFCFLAFDFPIDINSEEYDGDRKACFGSIFNESKKQKISYYFKNKFDNIDAVLKRRYFYRQNSFEIFTKEKKSYFFKFANNKIRDNIFKNIKDRLKTEDIKILNYESGKTLGFYNKNFENSAFESLDKKYRKWMEWEISTLEMLMYLNIYANRSTNDLMQYPVFPWPVMDYDSSDISDLSKDGVLRPFNLPVGMLTKPSEEESFERKNGYLEHYAQMKEEEKIKKEQGEIAEFPIFYGSHYSTSLYVTHYLVRVFPFAYLQIELQGSSFDDPNRIFNSLERSFSCTLTQKCDIRELIPEFFCLPEMLYNFNDFNLGKVKSKTNPEERIPVKDVRVPQWANEDGFTFIQKHRHILESKEVSESIHNWLDLIFGYKQKGKKAEEAFNIFNKESYDDFEKEYDKLDKDKKLYSVRMVEFGLTPTQLFSSEAAQRYKIDDIRKPNGRLTHFNEEISVKVYVNEFLQFPSFSIKIFQEGAKFIVITCSYLFIKFYEWKRGWLKDQRGVGVLEEIKPSKKIPTKIFYGNNSRIRNQVIAIYAKGAYIAIGGYWNGRITILTRKEEEITIVDIYNFSPVVCIKVDEENLLSLCGTKNGALKVYSIEKNNKENWTQIKCIYDHNDEITDICINNILNIFCTTAKDGYIMVYTLPQCKLINSFMISEGSFASKCLISSCPLPCFVLYVEGEKKNKIVRISINGTQILSNEGDVVSWRLIRNESFEEFVMYTTKNGKNYEVNYLSLPGLEILKNMVISNSKVFDLDVSKDCNFAIFLKEEENRKQTINILKSNDYLIPIP